MCLAEWTGLEPATPGVTGEYPRTGANGSVQHCQKNQRLSARSRSLLFARFRVQPQTGLPLGAPTRLASHREHTSRHLYRKQSACRPSARCWANDRKLADTACSRGPRQQLQATLTRGGWQCAQVRGFANRDPDPGVLPAARVLVEKLGAVVAQGRPSPPPNIVSLGEPPAGRAATMPRSARRIGWLEWGESPNPLARGYYLSMDRTHTLWLLWVRGFTTSGTMIEPYVAAHCRVAARNALRPLRSCWWPS